MIHQKICSRLVELIKGIFPKHTEFKTWCDESRMSCICRIAWKLNNDKNRPNKPSRIILIAISYEALEDYKDSSSNEQKNSQIRFKKIIETKYNDFNPNHDSPKYQTPLMEEWLITTGLINK